MKSKFFGYLFSISALSIFAFNFLFSGTKVQSQKVETQNGNEKPILIKPSTILEDLDKYKKSNPQISPQELAKFGNLLQVEKKLLVEASNL